jgi:hypothetical protein
MKLKGSLMMVFGALALMAVSGSEPAQADERSAQRPRAMPPNIPRTTTQAHEFTARPARRRLSYWPEDVINTSACRAANTAV